MLKFDQFRKFRDQLEEDLTRRSKRDEYDRFFLETLSKYNKAKSVDELDDESYPKFLDELKTYRVSRKLNESSSDDFRAECIEDLQRQSVRVKYLVSEEVTPPFKVYVAGSVLDPAGFDGSVDIAVVTEASDPSELALTLRKKFSWGFTFGPLNVTVVAAPKKGWLEL